MNLIFDFDGTLADSLDEALKIVNLYLEKRDNPLITKRELRTQGVEALIKKRNISRLTIFFALIKARHEIAKHIQTIDIFPSLSQILRKLSKKHTLGIVSSNSAKNIEVFLSHHKIASCFAFVQGERSMFGKHKKIKKILREYKFSIDETVYIGDEGRDVLAAKKSGIKSVAVTWGFESKSVLKKYSPDKIIDAPKLLLKI